MSIALKPLNEQVIVITGASSGIGLATARAAARDGAKLVLASRAEEALMKIVADLTASGAEAIHVVADVGNREDVEEIARVAVARFGGIDTWVNNAGHSIYGKLREVLDEDHRRIFETNFWGTVYGSLVAVPLLEQRGRGALINVGSVAGDVGIPLQGMYSATKHAVKGFTNALRMELEEAGAPISVTLIKPTGTNTAFPHHARNYTDHEPKLPNPVYPPEEVAQAILYAAVHGGRDVYVGGAAKLMATLGKLAPRLYDKLAEKTQIKDQLSDEAPRNPEGTLYKAGEDGAVDGDHPSRVMRTSLYNKALRHPLVTSALLAAIGLGLTAGTRMRTDFRTSGS